MENIVDYVKKYGDMDLTQREFSKEDAIVLSQFVYYKFDTVFNEYNKDNLSLGEIARSACKDDMFTDFRYEKGNREMLDAMLASKRFGKIVLTDYVNRVEEELETQFAAVTVLFYTGEIFVAFRGTDENIVGWKEDFSLALKKPITGQVLSAEYLNHVVRKFDRNVYIGGHSKGGNLAVYASMKCDADVKARISHIYSCDGPGFRPEVLKQSGYDDIKDRVTSIIPRSSLVGMLFALDSNTIVIDARAIGGVMQHNPYTWVVKNGLLKETRINDQNRFVIESFNQWVLTLDDERLERFVKVFDETLTATGAETILDFSKDKVKYASTLIKNARDIDEETKEFLMGLMKSFTLSFTERIKGRIRYMLPGGRK